MLLNRFLLFMTALCLGHLLQRLHLPIPFLLGGMLTAVACKTMARRANVSWPKKWREYALMIAGYGIGSAFTADTWHSFLEELGGVVGATAAIFCVSLLLAWLMSHVSTENVKSCIIGMLPGGMTMSMLLTEEDKEINANSVMVMQVIRLISVVVTVPFLVVYFLDAKVAGGGAALAQHGGVHWLVMVPLVILGNFVAVRIHLPTPRLLGPILATAAFAVYADGVQPVPFWLMPLAQVSIGLFMGMQLDADRIIKAKNVVPFSLAGTAVMIAVSIVIGQLLSQRYGFSLITAFLAMAPGGIAEMSLAGMSMQENVSVILTYQLVRILVINLCVPPFLKLLFKRK